MRTSDKKQVARIDRIIVPWLRRLDLFNTWEVMVEIVKEEDMPETGGAECTYATVSINHPYRRADLEINRDWANKVDNIALERTLLHELVHVLLHPLVGAASSHVPRCYKPYFDAAHEGVTETFTHLLLWDSKGRRQHGTTSGRS